MTPKKEKEKKRTIIEYFLIRELVLTGLIIIFILGGFVLYGSGYIFLGYFNYFIGCLSIYYLSYKYFKEKEKEKKNEKTNRTNTTKQ